MPASRTSKTNSLNRPTPRPRSISPAPVPKPRTSAIGERSKEVTVDFHPQSVSQRTELNKEQKKSQKENILSSENNEGAKKKAYFPSGNKVENECDKQTSNPFEYNGSKSCMLDDDASEKSALLAVPSQKSRSSKPLMPPTIFTSQKIENNAELTARGRHSLKKDRPPPPPRSPLRNQEHSHKINTSSGVTSVSDVQDSVTIVSFPCSLPVISGSDMYHTLLLCGAH